MNPEAAAGLAFEDLAVGMAAEAVKTVGEAEVEAFAAVSGDRNPLHLDAAFAERTPFKERIAHGMLAGGYISALLGGALPGPGAVYVSQSLQFKRPIKLGDEVTVRVEITAMDPKTRHVTLACSCRVRGKKAVEGVAVVIPPVLT